MSDYGSRGYHGNPDDYGWAGRGSGDHGGDRGGPAGRGDHGGQRYDGYSDRGDYGGRSDGYGSSSYGDHGSHGRGGASSYDGYGSSRGPSSGGYDDYGSSRGAAPVSGGGYDSYREHDEPTTGRASVPGGDSTGPGRARGSARVGAKRKGPGRDLSPEEAEAMKKAKKKKKRRRRLIAVACVLVMLIGIGTVAASIFFESVPLPDELGKELDQNATILYSDGSPMATIGSVSRKVLTEEQMPDYIEKGLVAAEDRKFYQHDGVDFWGVMRALWNNVTGGDTQGASTLEQQYVGQIADIRDDHSYFRKAREAVMAMKLGDEMTKPQILNAYLNLMPFGRQAYGVGAAAKAFYGEKTDPEKLTASQCALLVAQLKASGGYYDPDDPSGLVDQGIDTRANAEERWKYVLDSLLTTKGISQEEYDKAIEEGLPETIEPFSENEGQKKSTGFVSHIYALNEAAEILGMDPEQLSIKGYSIQTTIDKDLQKAAVDIASRKDGSYMDEQKDNLRAALVAVDPRTGRVLAYFGGTTDGTGIDKAGHQNMHPPGSSFKEFTMLTALKNGYSVDSLFDGSSPQEFDERPDNPVMNSENVSEPKVSLRDVIIKSLNTPIYALTNLVGASEVLKTARDMGISQIKDPETGEIWDLYDEDIAEKLNSDNKRALVDNEIGFGQYPVSVMDMAAANATLSNRGIANSAHFVTKIMDGDKVIYDDSDHDNYHYVKTKQVVEEWVADNAIEVSRNVRPNDAPELLDNGQQYAGKTGTWEHQCVDGEAENCDKNAHIWYAGFTRSLSAAVWVGDKEDENGVVTDQWGGLAWGSTISGQVWLRFMQKAATILDIPQDDLQFPVSPHGGDATRGTYVEKPDDGNKDCKPHKPEDCDSDDNQPPPSDGTCDPALPDDPDCQGNGGGEECGPEQPGWPECGDDGIGTPDSFDDRTRYTRVQSYRSPAEPVTVWQQPAATRPDLVSVP